MAGNEPGSLHTPFVVSFTTDQFRSFTEERNRCAAFKQSIGFSLKRLHAHSAADGKIEIKVLNFKNFCRKRVI